MKSESVEVKLRIKLEDDLNLLKKSAASTRRSMRKCERIGIKPEYSFNLISHEYEEEDIGKIYTDTLKLAPLLMKAIDSAEQFLSNKDSISFDGRESVD